MYPLIQYRKSELALKYAYRLRRHSAETSIFWLPAETIHKFHRSYVAIARCCWIPGHEDPAADVMELVKHWLEQEENGRWLMVIDNAGNGDDDASLTEDTSFVNSGLLSRYIPSCVHGYVLITTRNGNVGNIFALNELVEVGSMTEEESCALIQARLPHEDDENDIAVLALLHKMIPLALVRATNEIISRKPLRLKDYVESLLTKNTADDQITEIPERQKASSVEEHSLLSILPYVEGATYNSTFREHEPLCLPGTRTDVLNQIMAWSEDPTAACIFWLNGMAGTGKSTIARTVARNFDNQKRLGASFFFSRDRADLGHAAEFFTTLAIQLAKALPALKEHICQAITEHIDIAHQSLQAQWEQLILQPLSMLKGSQLQPPNLVFVIDALDECESDNDARVILRLLSEAKDLNTSWLRVFITSRPELPIRIGFLALPGLHQDLILHDISQSEHDIYIFLKNELANIRKDHYLPTDWPGEPTIRLLVQRANGLFIYAMTTCRFIGNNHWSPEEGLSLVLQHDVAGSSLDRIYTQILRHSVLGDCTDQDREALAGLFRQIVGSIAILFEPLSGASLARLLDTPEKTIYSISGRLHSILDVPESQDTPIRLMHPSFRDFLLDRQRCLDLQFWVNKSEAHSTLVEKSLKHMSSSLRRDICNLRMPGALVSEVKSNLVERFLPVHVQYACCYWVDHLQQGKNGLCGDNGPVHIFLQKHFLHWLEALSLMKHMSRGVIMVRTLESMLTVSGYKYLPYSSELRLMESSRLMKALVCAPLSKMQNDSSSITDQLLRKHLFKRIALLSYLHLSKAWCGNCLRTRYRVGLTGYQKYRKSGAHYCRRSRVTQAGSVL
jgi:NACHT domain